MYRKILKRSFDVISIIMVFAFLWPIIGVLVIVVRFKLGSPVLFRQQRPGLNGAPFNIYKFRTMTNAYGEDGTLMPDADRLTQFGRFLRSTSLDELPELWNVLKGEMSLVGPRPLLMQYLPLYTPEQMRRHDVRPGITGWAQVNGRNAISWEDKFKLDVWYVENVSFMLDMKILYLTVLKIVKREDINQPGHVTIKPFKGSRP